MNYSKNIPDWQQYNALQSGAASDGATANLAVASVSQNVNPNQSFVPSISPPSINNMNPNCINKSQPDANFGSRNYPNVPPPNGYMPDSGLTPMVHMTNCISHYANSNNLNPMMEDPMNNDFEHHRNTIPEEISTHRSNVPMNGTASHVVGTNMNMNNGMVSTNSRIPPNNSMSNRQTPFMQQAPPCKGPCCVGDANMTYGYGSYPPANAYRENMHMNYNADDRRYRSSSSYRKDSYSSKSSNQYHVDQRQRTYPDYKYRKDSTMSRNYHQSSVILPNYGMQNYNMSADYMKYHHYPARNTAPSSMSTPPNNPSGMIKFHDMPKHPQYPNNPMMHNMMPNVNPPAAMQNPYYSQTNAPPRDFVNENRETMDRSNTRMQPPSGPYAKHQMYRQKFAIQRFTLENQLKEMTQVPGYLSNPKYQECVLRYRELLKLQRTVEFQSSIQESSINANANIPPPISPINLQFDHNGVLINSNYLPTNYPSVCNQSMNPGSNAMSVDKSTDAPDVLNNPANGQLMEPVGQKKVQDAASVPTNSDQTEFSVPQVQQKSSKDFADKPDLDVRQFLATWDESEEEENALVLGKETTPVTVVELADLNLIANIGAEGQKEYGILQGSPTTIPTNGTVKINKVVGVVCNDANDVPTIHIVDNLDNKIVVEKIDNVNDGISAANIKCIKALVSKDIAESQTPKSKTDCSKTNDDQTVARKSSTNAKSKEDGSIGSKNGSCRGAIELGNQDDFSLPELTAYDCPAVSTSLNTPTHSDNEESLETVTHLRMSTNPIEIVKNSPIISFSQPDQGNKSNGKPSTRTPKSNNLENEEDEWFSSTLNYDKSGNKDDELSLPTISEHVEEASKLARKKRIVDEPNVCDKIVEQFCNSGTTNIPLIPGEDRAEIGLPVSPMEDNCLTKVMKSTPPVTSVSIADSDGERNDKEDDIWMQMEKSLEDSSSQDSSKEQLCAHKLKKLLKHKSQTKKMIDFKKIKSLLKSDIRKYEINERFNSLLELLKNDDSSSSSQSSDNNYRHKRRGSKDYGKLCERLDDKYRRCCDSSRKKSKWRSKSVEPNLSNDDEREEMQQFRKLKRKRSIGNGADNEELEQLVIQNKNSEEKEGKEESGKAKQTENRIVKYERKKDAKEFEIQLKNVNFRINDKDLRKGLLKNDEKAAKDAVEAIKIEINLSCLENNKTTKTLSGEIITEVDKELQLKDAENESTSHCDKMLVSKLSKDGVLGGSDKSSQCSKLPQVLKNDICRNEFLPLNFPECLTTKDLTEKSGDCKKKNEVIEVHDPLKMLNKSSKFPDELYHSKLFDYTKDMNIYHLPSLKSSKLMPSLNLDTFSTNFPIDCSDPCSSTKQRFVEKLFNYNFDKGEALPYKLGNPLTFRNYIHEDTFEKNSDEEKPSGFFNPAFMDDVDKMNTVPIYTTKDGKIKYSPNRKFTYKTLFTESDKLHERASIYANRYHAKLRDKKKHKSKHEMKSHKLPKDYGHSGYEGGKHESVISKLQSNEAVRDCSVIAIAPSNLNQDKEKHHFATDLEAENNDKVSSENKAIENNRVEVIQEKESEMTNQSEGVSTKATYHEENSEENSTEKLSNVVVESRKDCDELSNVIVDNTEDHEKGFNVVKENRSTVIKQLGTVSQNLALEFNNDNDDNVNEVDQLKETVVIQKDDPKSVKQYETTNPENVEDDNKSIPETGVLINMKSVIKKKSEDDDFPNMVVFKEDSKKCRRYSASAVESSKHEVIKGRRKSFESSDIVITSIFHDKDHDLRDSTGAESKMERVLEDDVFENKMEEQGMDQIATKVSSNVDLVPMEIDEDIPKQSGIIYELDHNVGCDFVKDDLAVESVQSEMIECSVVDENLVSLCEEVEKRKTEIIQDKEDREPRNQIYLEYENVIIKEEEEEMEELVGERDQMAELEKDDVDRDNLDRTDLEKAVDKAALEDSVPELDKEELDDIPPLEKADSDFENSQSNESIECPKLESQVEVVTEIPGDEFEGSSKSMLRLSSSENNFREEVNGEIAVKETKIVPKLVIKKSESLSKLYSRSKSGEMVDRSTKREMPKIPKMIIRNASSRPESPTIEEISASKSRSNKTDVDSSKVPKMKISLENELPKVVVENMDIHAIQKTIPKMKIKKVRSLMPLIRDGDRVVSSRRSRSSDDAKFDSDSQKDSHERVPKLKIRKESSSSNRTGIKRSSSSSLQSAKRQRKYSKEREDSTNLSEYECNTNDVLALADKVPKVIIKRRTSSKSAFKCERSKSKQTVLWQPKVTLNRSWILDTMAKEFRNVKVALKLTSPKHSSNDTTKVTTNLDSNKLKWDKFLSDLKTRKTETVSFDIKTCGARKRQHTSMDRDLCDSEDSQFNLTLKDYDENMNSRDKEDSDVIQTKRICGFEISTEKNDYASDDACFSNISGEKTNDKIKLCPVIDSDDSCTKMSTLSEQQTTLKQVEQLEEQCVIKVESDESQTTIELLPASPDFGPDDTENLTGKLDKSLNDTGLIKLNLNEKLNAIQFVSEKRSSTEIYDDHRSKKDDSHRKDKRKSSSEKTSSSRSDHSRTKHRSSSHRHKDAESKQHHQSCKSSSAENLSSSDLLAKEVLAAKETLKQCFTKCRNESMTNPMCNINPKTVSDKVDSFSSIYSHSDQPRKNHDNQSKSRNELDSRSRHDRSRKSKSSRSRSRLDHDHCNSSQTISLKEVKLTQSNTNNVEVTKKLASAESNHRVVSIRDMSNEKSAKSIKTKDKCESKEDMPILEPQVDVELPSTEPDRELSRSPPVITTQDSIENEPMSPKEEQLLKFDLYADESPAKNKQDTELTIAEIVRQLAFHEKATIKHRRYCTLCERWFPSVIRHEKHLSGYQHQHMELMQRRTIHTLYTLFTGKPCPKLLPPNMIRVDCAMGEPTPLQIVVQDIVIDCDDMKAEKKKHEKNNT